MHRKPKWILPVILIIVLVCGLIGGFLWYHFHMKTDLEAYLLLYHYMEQPEYAMNLSVTADMGSETFETEASIDRTTWEGHKITCIGGYDTTLYYTDSIVFLENGKAFQTGSACPNYANLLHTTAALFKTTDVSVSKDGNDSIYTITAKDNDADALLEILIPSITSQITGMQTIRTELIAADGVLTEIHFSADAVLVGSNMTKLDLYAVLTAENPDHRTVSIPLSVKDALRSQDYETTEILTEDLMRFLSAWISLNDRTPLVSEVTLYADCGPIRVNDTLMLEQTNINNTTLYRIQKNGMMYYFTEEAVCDENGNTVKDDSLKETARLYDVINTICMTGDFLCEASGNGYLYTLALDEAAMKAVIYAIAPETEGMDILFTEGQVQMILSDHEIRSIGIRCSGSVKIVLSDADVSVTVDMHFDEEKFSEQSSVSAPAAVIEKLTANQ